MKRHIIYIYALAALLLAGCGSSNPKATALLQQADSLMDAQPDSALHLLESHQMDKDTWSRPQRMRWELLRAKAMNKAYVPFTTDSVMLQVASYYDGGDPNDAMLAHYLLGCVYRDLGEAPRAIDSYQEAISKSEKSVDDKSTYRTLSSIYSQMANVYHRQLLLTNEIEARKKAYHYAESVGLTKIALYERKMSANAYSLLNERDTAEILLKEVLHLYEENDYIQDGLQSSILLMHLYAEQQEHLDELEKLIKRFDSESNLFDENHELKSRYRYYYYYKGRYFESIDLLDSAENYYRKVQYPNMSFVAHNSMYKGLLSVYAKRHDADSIAKYAHLYCQANDSSIAKKDMELTAQMEASYNYNLFRKQALSSSEKANKRLVYIIILLVLSIIGLIMMIIIRHKNQQLKKEKRELVEMLQATKEEISEKTQQLKEINDKHQQTVKSIKNKLGLAVTANEEAQAVIETLNKQNQMETQRLMMEIEERQKRVETLEHQLFISGYKEKSDPFFRLGIVKRIKIYARDYKACLSDSDQVLLCNSFKEYYPELINDMMCASTVSNLGMQVCFLVILQLRPNEITHLLNISSSQVGNLKKGVNAALFGDSTARTLYKNLSQRYKILPS